MQASVAQQSLILEMQSLDNEIMQANTKLKSLPEIEQLLHIDKRITTATDELAVVKSEADQIALELRRGEVDVETVTDRIKKDEARLASGNATPKELEQLQHEVGTLKKIATTLFFPRKSQVLYSGILSKLLLIIFLIFCSLCSNKSNIIINSISIVILAILKKLSIFKSL